jgi:hypothetical protein
MSAFGPIRHESSRRRSPDRWFGRGQDNRGPETLERWLHGNGDPALAQKLPRDHQIAVRVPQRVRATAR